MMRLKLLLFILSFYGMAYAGGQPFCATKVTNNQPLIIGYLGADSTWALKNTDQIILAEQLSQVSLINYSFIRFAQDKQGNTIIKPSDQDIENIQLLQQLKPDLPIMIAVGGWGDREGFSNFLDSESKIDIFVQSVKDMINQYHLDGIDIDWENELLASSDESSGLLTLLRRLHETLSDDGYCVSNAVPGTKAYWTNYPNANLWHEYVNWTTVMTYDNYGTFGPKSELASALYESNRINDSSYPYPNTSGNRAVTHYYHQGLPAHKIVLGIPFYCHSYYVDSSLITENSVTPGLHVPVVDPNISSQISYVEAYSAYAEQLYSYAINKFHTVTYYGLIPVKQNGRVKRFMSCEGRPSVLDKIAYVKGKNPMSTLMKKNVKLGGVSFWSLQQDLPFSHPKSLLRAIHEGFQ